jgi:SAM-dependent methyltransferase
MSGLRICPHCKSSEPIKPGETLWSASWSCGACHQPLPSSGGFVQLAPELDEEHEGFDLENFELLPSVEGGHFWFISRNELVHWLVRKFSPDAKSALEIGCGTGFVLYALRDALPGARISGSELHSRGLVTARSRHKSTVDLIQMDARSCGLRDAVDLVCAFDVLEHIPEDEDVLSQITEMLRPGGRLIATVPQHPWMWSTPDDLAHHQRRYKIGELSKKAKAAGLKPLYASSFMTVAFPLMMASRVLGRNREQPRTLREQVEAEYKLSPTTNKALLTLCRFEHQLRKLGLPLPFGGSQLVVAEKPL